MKHWYTTAVIGEQEDGSRYTVCTQKFFVDDERVLVNLADVFINAGVGVSGTPLRAYIARNSVGMVDDKGVRMPMAPVDQATQIVMGALSTGYGEHVNIQDAMAYMIHLTNVLAKNALAAYLAEAPVIPSDAEGSQGDDGP